MSKLFILLFSIWTSLYISVPSFAGTAVYEELAEVPILSEGRVKPLDTFARTHLLAFSGKSKLPDGQLAIDWLAEVLFAPNAAVYKKIFDIRNPQVLASLEIVPDPKGHLYSFSEIAPAFDRIKQTISELFKKQEEEKTPEQKQLLTLYSKAVRFNELTHALSDADVLKIIPAQWSTKGVPVRIAEWYSFADLRTAGQSTPESEKYLQAWRSLEEKFQSGSPEQKADLLREISTQAKQMPKEAVSSFRLKLEYVYNQLDLFTMALAFYILAFLLILFSEIPALIRFQKMSFWSMLIAFGFHLVGLVMRITIMQRPPVATLYESIIFVALTVGFLSVVYESRRKNTLGIIAGSSAAAVLLFISNGYAADGDTMGMLAAVLNSNFWLGTHVVMITVGYGCSIVAGILGHVYLLKAIFSKKPKLELDLELADLNLNMVGASLIALFFCLFGTILGGIWADQSWGRFWGWDPKENGALLIVLWLLMIIHGKLSGNLRPIAYAAGLVLTNAIVAIAWFGVNLLNVGLHSYGFTENVALNLFAFVGAELVLAAFGYFFAYKRSSSTMSA